MIDIEMNTNEFIKLINFDYGESLVKAKQVLVRYRFWYIFE